MATPRELSNSEKRSWLTILGKNTDEVTLRSAVSAPILKVVQKFHGKHETLAAISAAVFNGLQGITVNHGMTNVQVGIFCEDFLEVYYTDSLEDLVMMFKYLRRGELGTIYNRLDVPTLFEAYKAYLLIKLEEKEKTLKMSKVEASENIYERSAAVLKAAGVKRFEFDNEKDINVFIESLKEMDMEQLKMEHKYRKDPIERKEILNEINSRPTPPAVKHSISEKKSSVEPQ